MDEREFIELINKNNEIMYACFERYCRDLNKADIIQEIILEAWKSVDKFEKRCKFSTWFYAIARNVCINALRKKQKEPITVEPEPYGDILIEVTNTCEMLKQVREAIRYNSLITTIEEPYRSLFEAYLQGITFDELEQQTGISNAALRVRIHRIKKELYLRFRKNENIKQCNA